MERSNSFNKNDNYSNQFITPRKGYKYFGGFSSKHKKLTYLPYSKALCCLKNEMSDFAYKSRTSIYKQKSRTKYKNPLLSKIKGIISKSQSCGLLPFSTKREKINKNERLSIQMSEKLLENIRGNYYQSMPQKNVIKEDHFRNKVLRDYKSGGGSFEAKKLIENSKNKYDELNDVLLHKQKKQINKSYILINNFEEKKNKKDGLFSLLPALQKTQNKKRQLTSTPQKKRLNIDESLNKYYEYRTKKKVDVAKQIAEEILEINCDEYEELKCISGIVNCSTKLLSEKNLKRKIKLHNIEQKHFDYENDLLCEKNVPLLKELLKTSEIETVAKTKDVLPKFLKKKLKNTTIKKFNGLCGNFFGVN